jgi:predicted nucleotidyltransferase
VNSSSLADALFPTVRQRVLGVLYGHPDRSFYGNEVIALAHSGTGAVQRELKSLASVGLLEVRKVGHQVHYQANTLSPVFSELRAIVLKTSGLADVLREALSPVLAKIAAAFVFGSMARHEDTVNSDIDLVIVSATLAYGDIFLTLEKAEESLRRKINPTLYTPKELAKKLSKENAFVKRVLDSPKIWVIGDERDLHGKPT